MADAITVTELVVRRGKATVLDGLTCRIAAGRITGLLGPSGAGKTTLIRAVVGVQVVRAGTVTVLGRPAGTPALRDKIGYVSQSPSIYLDLTVAENTNYFAAVAGVDRSAARAAIEQVGLAEAAGQLAGNLSGGQQSRASLACAIVGDPPVLVLDEPTVGLDPVLREELWDFFAQRARDGVSVLVSSHVMDEANRCDTLLLMRAGELLADETPAAIKQRAGTDDMDRAFLNLIRAGAAR
ncbi:ABC transporter ATP-binding protein [Nakamurella multipartita]|uniref:ABC transporter related n=1 Tax=Nakamurella multipartita (strain ATCC 700099 / DSM 44233 / CIP 104796 / JCM 9543 / NBRC 105858 / Y-104) TaxID=479431 RepID=C8X7C4_NAKMY|nr:ABC transporter ATP-binding protein [Nakamurella multipartita]ACV76993.1 ABC transporter related [Nakamurella multipartita DSM 44233]